MFLLLLLICTFSKICAESGESDDEGKFIDLLPQEEKDAFIKSVARRLVSGVNTKDSRYKSNEEISDEVLDQQSDYVRKIIKEENNSLRRQGVKLEDKRDFNDKLQVQGLADNETPINVEDDENKDHIDLTLRQGHRNKRNEKESNSGVDNKEFIPVMTVYDDENREVVTNESNTKDIKNGMVEVDYKSKEDFDEDSAIEDIQVRGRRTHSRGSRQAVNNETDFETSPQAATVIENFEPNVSHEFRATPSKSHEETTTDIINHQSNDKEEEEKSSGEFNNDVKHSQNRFTAPIYDSHESIHPNESFESATDSTIMEPTETETTKFAESSTQKIPVASIVETILTNKTILRSNDEQEKEIEIPTFENNNETSSHNVKDTVDTSTTKSNVEIDKGNSITENNTSNIGNNDGDVTTEHENNTSYEHNDTVFNTSNVDDVESLSTNKSLEKLSVLNENDSTTENDDAITRNTPLDSIPSSTSKETSLKYNLYVIQKENTDDTQDLEQQTNNGNSIKQHTKSDDNTQQYTTNDDNVKQHIRNDSKINVETEHFGQPKNVKFSDEVSTIRSVEDIKMKAKDSLITTTEYQNNEPKITEIVNISHVPNYLRNAKNDTPNNDLAKRKDFEEDGKYVTFAEVYDSSYVLTTARPDGNLPQEAQKYQIFYSAYIPKKENYTKTVSHARKYEVIEKQTNVTEYETQNDNLEKTANALRQGLLQEDEGRVKLVEPRGNIKTYEVYEIPANEAPFVPVRPEPNPELAPESEPEPEPELELKEQPYYVPVYNYDPSNAYYNAYNRLGPNDEDDDQPAEFYMKQPDGHRKFRFNNKKRREKTYSKPKVVNTKYKPKTSPNRPHSRYMLPVVANRPKFAEIYFNPDQYVDMDYYFERSRQPDYRTKKKRKHKVKKHLNFAEAPFPDSDDELHPYNNMGTTGVKNHMNAVRQVMFQHKLFGYVPEITSPRPSAISTSHEHHGKDHDLHHEHDHNGHDHEHLAFRASNDSEYIVLAPEDKVDDEFEEIPVDYYFGLPKGTRYEDFLRHAKEIAVVEQNNTNLVNLVGKIKTRRGKKAPRKNQKREAEDKEEWKNKSGTIKDILGIGDVRDAFPNFNKLREMGIRLVRRTKGDDEVKVYVNVLRDMVKMENRALEKFDWLGSTVNVLSAVKKLKYLTERQQNQEKIRRSDVQLLNYVLYLFMLSKSSLDHSHDDLRNHLLPRNKNRKKEYLPRGLLNRVWLYRGRIIVETEEINNYGEFLKFLDDLNNSLYDLYNALKHIAMVTKYNKQHWFTNLKSLYLRNGEEKESLQLLLHIFTSRLVELLEDNAVNGAEYDYLEYVEKNQKEVKRSKEEFVFVLKLLRAIKNIGP